eukprot:839167-Lingulodinium_polyedra.AAC.1
MLEAATTDDQLNAGESLCPETFARRYQLRGDVCSTQLVAAECGPGREVWPDERCFVLGKARSRGSVSVAPELE